MPTVQDVLAQKGRVVHSVSRASTVEEAILLMVERDIGSVLVTEDGAMVGIFTERDVLRRVALAARDPRATGVAEVMTPDPVHVAPERTIGECMALMTDRRIRHLPVVEGGRPAGMISIGDIVKYLSGARAAELSRLTAYIHGQYPG